MAKSSRSYARGGMRAGFEYFDRRQTGPWQALRPLFRGWGLLAVAAGAVALIAGLGWSPYVVLGLVGLLFLASFALTWQLVGLLVRARAILLVAAVLVAGNVWFTSMVGEIAGNVLWCLLLVALLAFPPTRIYLLRRTWCVLDRHRIRACLKQCKVRTMNRDGALPLMLWARPTKTGERVWLWIRAGASGDDIADALSFIAPACFARDARLHTVRRLSTLVAVDIIRRDPLATSDVIPSPLAQLVDAVKDSITGESTDAIRPVKIIDITTMDPKPMKNGHNGSASSSRKSKNTHTEPEPVPQQDVDPRLLVAGEDLSDYID